MSPPWHRHRARRRRRGPKTLQRRLFRWFVAAILATIATVGGVLWLFGDSSWRKQHERVEQLARRRLTRVWDDPLERAIMVRDLEQTLGVSVELKGEDGEVLFPAPPCDGPTHRVHLEGRGWATLCMPPPPGFHFGNLAAALGLAAVVLMGLSGALARRLGRPLRQVTHFAERLGDGDLDARLKPHRRDREAALLARTLNEMAERIGKQLADQKALLAEASHELRTPLGHARILVEMLPDEAAETRAELEKELEEMDRLVGRLLARSRLDFEAVEPRPLDPGEIAAQALERAGLAPTLLDGSAAPETFEADPTLLLRALANLIENAERHGHGLTALEVRAEGDSVVFAVHDGGPGPVAPSESSGLGLGLPLVERIAAAHGGSLTLRAGARGGAVAEMKVASDQQKPSN